MKEMNDYNSELDNSIDKHRKKAVELDKDKVI